MTCAPNVLIVFSSLFGANADLASRCEKVLTEAGATVRVRGVPQLVLSQHETPAAKEFPVATTDDLIWANGYVFTSPVHTGSLSASIKAFVDEQHDGATSALFSNRTFTAMATAELPHSGQETVVNQLNMIGTVWGCVVVAPSTAYPSLNREDGNAYGLSFTLEKGKLPENITPQLTGHLTRFVELTEALAKGQTARQAQSSTAAGSRHTIGEALG